jgi:hypothetical protein
MNTKRAEKKLAVIKKQQLWRTWEFYVSPVKRSYTSKWQFSDGKWTFLDILGNRKEWRPYNAK